MFVVFCPLQGQDQLEVDSQVSVVNGRDDLSDQLVQVTVGGSLHVEVPEVDGEDVLGRSHGSLGHGAVVDILEQEHPGEHVGDLESVFLISESGAMVEAESDIFGDDVCGVDVALEVVGLVVVVHGSGVSVECLG